MMSWIKKIALVVSLSVVSFAANAALITFDPILASWINIVPGSGISVSGNGTTLASMRWGTNVGFGQSGYDFSTAATPLAVAVPPSPSADFVLGSFTHLNNPITGTSLTSATLRVDTVVDVDGTNLGSISFLFDFTHNETPNNANPCANGQPNGGTGANRNGCADIVSISPNVATGSFSVGGVAYTMNIAGFMSGGFLVNEFQTVERLNNTANLIANLVIDARQVPEPGSLALFGIGLLALGLRKKLAAA